MGDFTSHAVWMRQNLPALGGHSSVKPPGLRLSPKTGTTLFLHPTESWDKWQWAGEGFVCKNNQRVVGAMTGKKTTIQSPHGMFRLLLIFCSQSRPGSFWRKSEEFQSSLPFAKLHEIFSFFHSVWLVFNQMQNHQFMLSKWSAFSRPALVLEKLIKHSYMYWKMGMEIRSTWIMTINFYVSSSFCFCSRLSTHYLMWHDKWRDSKRGFSIQAVIKWAESDLMSLAQRQARLQLPMKCLFVNYRLDLIKSFCVISLVPSNHIN